MPALSSQWYTQLSELGLENPNARQRTASGAIQESLKDQFLRGKKRTLDSKNPNLELPKEFF